ncbi:hypothetical protein FRC12_010198 [Ceratobasidium sp. 428]|nr:hypothetical protein FRC12_010198 [Ceratobasidium sp. 428]
MIVPLPSETLGPLPAQTVSPVGVVHVPMLWMWVSLLSGLVWLVVLQVLAQHGLFVMIRPTTHVNVRPRIATSGGTPERTGRLIFSIPFLALVWYGWLTGLRLHSLFRFAITKCDFNYTVLLSYTNEEYSNTPPPARSSPLAHSQPAYIMDFIHKDHFHNHGLLLGLEFEPPLTSFGPWVENFTEQKIDYHPFTPDSTSTSKASFCYTATGSLDSLV